MKWPLLRVTQLKVKALNVGWKPPDHLLSQAKATTTPAMTRRETKVGVSGVCASTIHFHPSNFLPTLLLHSGWQRQAHTTHKSQVYCRARLKDKEPFTLTLMASLEFCIYFLYVFRLWEEAGVPRESQHSGACKLNSERTCVSPLCCDTTVPTIATPCHPWFNYFILYILIVVLDYKKSYPFPYLQQQN